MKVVITKDQFNRVILKEEEIDPYANKVYDPISDEWVSKEEDTELVGNSDNEEDYDEEFYEQMEEDANTLIDERSDVLFNHIYECLLNLDITGLYRNTQREFLNKYNDIDWSDEAIYWDLPIEIIKKPIPQNGFNIEDLAHILLEEIEKRMEFQSKHENPDSLTDYSDIG